MQPLVQGFTQIHIMLQIILHGYMNNSYCVTTVSKQQNMDMDVSLINVQLIHINADDDNFLINMLNASEMGCSDYIVQMSNPALFMEALEEIVHTGNQRRSDRKLIIIPPSNENEHDIDNLLNVLKMKKTRYVANILLIVPTDEATECESYNLVTHKFVGVDNHDDPVILDTWNGCTGTFVKNANLFPHDMANLQGKIINVSSFTYNPYILLDLDKRMAPLGYDGTEMRIIIEFCRWLNFTIELTEEDGGQWGVIYENRTGVGIIGQLIEDKADIGIGSLGDWYHEYLFLDQSAPQLWAGVSCLVPTPRVLTNWMLPVLPFSPLMWGAVAVTLLLGSVALILAQRSTQGAFFNTYAMLVGQGQEDKESSPIKRYIIAWLLVTGLIIDSAYSGGLASVLTIPHYEKPINTIQELVDSNLEWGATHESWVFSLLLATDPKEVNAVKHFRVYNAEVLEKKVLTRDYAFSVERLHGGHYAVGDYITEDNVSNLKLMRENLYLSHIVTMFRKSSPLTKKYNQFISRLHTTGIQFYWESQVVLHHSNYKVQLEMRQSLNPHPELELAGLKFQNVMGAFIMLGCGCIASTLLLIAELVHGRAKRPIPVFAVARGDILFNTRK